MATNEKFIPSIGTLGLGMWWAWVWLAFFSESLFFTCPLLSQRLSYWLVFLISISLSLTIYVLLNQYFAKSLKAIVPVASISSCLGVLVCSLAPVPIGNYVGSAIMGVSAAIWFFDWLEYTVLHKLRAVGINVAAATAQAALIYFVLIDRPAVISTILLAAMPLASLLLYFIRQPVENKLPVVTNGSPRSFWAICRTVTAYTASFGIFEGLIATAEIKGLDLLTIGAIGAVALLFGLLIMLRPNLNTSVGIHQIPTPFFVAGLVLLTTDFANSKPLATLLIMMGWALFSIQSWIAIDHLAQTGRFARVHLIIAALCWHFGALVGAVLFYIFSVILQSSTFGLLPLLAVIALVGIASFGSFRGVEGSILAQLPTADAARDLPEDSNLGNLQIKDICARYGLSKRETEILLILAHGRSVAQIAKLAYISKSTASTHIQHIYQKLGIHTREDLFDLLELDTDKKSNEAPPPHHNGQGF